MFPISLIAENNQFNPFEPSEWNDADTLPKNAIKVIKYCKKNDWVYTVHNFALDFNLGDQFNTDEVLLFVPDEKFKDQIDKI